MEDLNALDGMKRAELQRLAKKAGIKANMKTDAIIKALKKHYGENGSLSAPEGTSCSEDNRTEDEATSSAPESASSSANEDTAEQEAKENTPPKKAARKGRKGRKRVKETIKPAAAVEPAKTPEQKPETPASDPTPRPLRRTTRSVTPKTDTAPTAPAKTTPAAPTVVQLRRTTRSVTPKSDSSGLQAKTTPAPVEVPVRRRRRTFEIEQEKTSGKVSKKEEEVIQSDPEMKKAIMAELEQKAEEKVALQSRIPKPKSMATKAGKPITPGNKDWSRIHQAHFNKMESIDDYVARKRKRTETLSASVKRAKLIADEAKAAVKNLTSHRTPQGSTAKIVKPVSRVRPTNLSFASPKPSTTKAPTKSVTFKMSRLKTPTRASMLLGGGGEPKQKRKSTPGPRKSVSVLETSARKSMLDVPSRKSVGESAQDKRKSIGASVTPFKFGQPTTPAASNASKPVFDLKTSLNKPLTYKPYTGKLKPLEASSRFQTTSNIQKAKANVMKKPALKTRDNRRAVAKQSRADKRANNLMARRGINAL